VAKIYSTNPRPARAMDRLSGLPKINFSPLVACNSRFGSATTGLILSGSVLSENLTTDFTIIGRSYLNSPAIVSKCALRRRRAILKMSV